MSTNDPRIVGGLPALDCQWPSVVDMSICSGVLVHPSIVIYAGHCGPQGQVQFGNGDQGFTISLNPEDCQVHPLWTIAGNDIAFCELPVEVTGVPFVNMLGIGEPLPEQGELVTIVGYGQTEEGSTGGFKNFGEAPYIGFEEGELRIGGNGVDTCTGDSGGPAMMEMDDGTWRVIGITSRAEPDSELCGGISRYTYAPTAVAWVEETSGVDVSPCFDGAVPMDCEPSDDTPDDPLPEWCDWMPSADKTGAEPTTTGGTWEADTTSGEDEGSGSSDDGITVVPGNDGCTCTSGQGGGVWPLVVLALLGYRAARMASW